MRLTSVSDWTMTRPGAGWIGSSDGTATTRQPAAVAEATPFGESSSATHCPGSTPSSQRGQQVGLRVGLVRRDVIPGDHDREPQPGAGQHRLGERPLRRCHQRVRDPGPRDLGEQFPRAGPHDHPPGGDPRQHPLHHPPLNVLRRRWPLRSRQQVRDSALHAAAEQLPLVGLGPASRRAAPSPLSRSPATAARCPPAARPCRTRQLCSPRGQTPGRARPPARYARPGGPRGHPPGQAQPSLRSLVPRSLRSVHRPPRASIRVRPG